MVRRSLLAKTALYGVLVFSLAIPAGFFVAHRLREAGRGEHIRGFVGPQLAYLKQELERATPQGTPQAQQLARLETPFNSRLRFVPWGQAAIPPELQDTPWLVDPRPLHRSPTHWIRLDAANGPLGAVAVSPQHGGPRGKGPPPRGPLGAGALTSLLLALLLAIVPPLYMWVLKPLRRMVMAAQRLGAGDLNTPIHTTRRDEFGELEQAFEHMRQEVKRSLEQRDRLLTDVSHEIRGPLARMTLALPLMRKEGASGPVCDIFAQELQAVEHLVGEALALARGGYAPAHSHEPVDLGALLKELLEVRQLWITQKNLQLSVDCQMVCVNADRQLLARAVGNLLDNALKYTRAGDKLHVATGSTGREAWVRIQDSGPGIAPKHLPLVFEPFYRPDTSRSRETGGAGLGLSIVKRIVENHGGTITLQCPKGEGTLAEIRLPLSQAPNKTCGAGGDIPAQPSA